ncbi:class II aldolase/adducin family protein [Lachnospiraceae bacterium 62-35]
MTINTIQVEKTRKELVTISHMAYQRGLTSGTSGNPSARVPGSPELVLIKATGTCFGTVEPEDFVLVDLDGNVLEGDKKPSKEVFFHCGIYKIRPDVQAVFHGHSAAVTAYATKKNEFPLITVASAALIKKVDIVEFALAGSPELKEMVIEKFTDTELKACVLKRHGFITVGPSITAAYYMGDVLEDNAKTLCYMDTLGA